MIDTKKLAEAWGISEAQAMAFVVNGERYMRIAEEIADTGVPIGIAFAMANDRLSALQSEAMLAAGEVTAVEAVHITGSYSALDLAYRLHAAGKLSETELLDHWADWWRSSDPDDTDSRFLEVWRRAWRRNGKRAVVDKKPLPAGGLLTVYRGQRDGQPLGMAWTLDRKIAEFFGARPGGRGNPVAGGVVIRAHVLRNCVLAYLTGRGESEVVVDPLLVRPPTSVVSS